MRVSVAAAALCAVLLAGACGPAPPGGGPAVVSEGGGAFEAALVAHGDRLVAAWYDTRDGNVEIYLRVLDAAGRPLGAAHRVTQSSAQSYEASLAVLADDVALAWYEKEANGALTPMLARVRLDGSVAWSTPLAAGGRNPVVRSDGVRVFAAWVAPVPAGGEGVWSGWWSADGTVATPARVIAAASATTWNLNAALLPDGAAIVAFDAAAGSRADEVFLARVVRDAAPAVVRLTADDGKASKYPDVAVGERIAVTWFDERDGNQEVYLATGAWDGLGTITDARARRVTRTPGASFGAYLAWNGTRIGVGWSDDTEGQHEIYLQAFDAAALPLTRPRRLTQTPSASLVPAIVPWRAGFALAWVEYSGRRHGHGGTSRIMAWVGL